MSKEIARQYKKYGVDILTSTKVETVTDHGDHVTVTYTPNDGGETQSIDADKVLMSIGFAPNVENFGLENTGVKLTDRGAIEIDDYMHTNVPAHLRDRRRHGEAAARSRGRGAGRRRRRDHRQGRDHDAGRLPHDAARHVLLTRRSPRSASPSSRRAMPATTSRSRSSRSRRTARRNGLGEPIGFVKLIADGEHLELLGGHLIGPDVSELLPELTLAQKWDLTALEAARNVHTHPTLSEAVQEAFHGLAGHMINL